MVFGSASRRGPLPEGGRSVAKMEGGSPTDPEPADSALAVIRPPDALILLPEALYP
jgi:hypothetical protein